MGGRRGGGGVDLFSFWQHGMAWDGKEGGRVVFPVLLLLYCLLSFLCLCLCCCGGCAPDC